MKLVHLIQGFGNQRFCFVCQLKKLDSIIISTNHIKNTSLVRNGLYISNLSRYFQPRFILWYIAKSGIPQVFQEESITSIISAPLYIYLKEISSGHYVGQAV